LTSAITATTARIITQISRRLERRAAS